MGRAVEHRLFLVIGEDPPAAAGDRWTPAREQSDFLHGSTQGPGGLEQGESGGIPRFVHAAQIGE